MAQNDLQNTSVTPMELLDEELEKCVLELMRNSRENYSDVHVHVDAQNVYFSGFLNSNDSREHLTELARMVNGVGEIYNDVTLKH